jgi:uncharacterized protein HemX
MTWKEEFRDKLIAAFLRSRCLTALGWYGVREPTRERGPRVLTKLTMLKKLMIVLALGLLAVCGWKFQQSQQRLAARVAVLEIRTATIKEGAVTAASAPLDSRVARLEERMRTLEDILEKKIVRQGINTDPKKIRDVPPGFDNSGLR